MRLQIANLVLDSARWEVRTGQGKLQLSKTEFQLLALLCKNHVVRREVAQQEVLAYPPHVSTRALDNHVYRLRKKLHTAGVDGLTIRTVRGVGYVIDTSSRDEGVAVQSLG